MAWDSRGLLAGVDGNELLRRLTRPPYRRLWDRMTARLRDVGGRAMQDPLPYLGYGHLGWHSVSPLVVEAGLMLRLTGDAQSKRYIEWCIHLLADIHGRPDAHKTLGQRVPLLSHGEIALAADLCRDLLEPSAIDSLKQLVRERMIDANDGDSRMLGFGGGANTPVCRAIQAGLVALVWGEDAGHSNWERVVDLARDAAVLYVHRGVDPGGYGYEGPGYCHGTLFYVYLLAQLLRQTGRDDLFAKHGVLGRIPQAAQSLLFPDRHSMGNTNDLGMLTPHNMVWLPLTARHYNRPADLGLWQAYQGPDHPLRPYGDTIDWTIRDTGREDLQSLHAMPYALTFLWWDEEAPATPLEQSTLPTANYSPGVETANFRTSWSREAVYLGVQGAGRSHVCHGHAHADCGHFSLFAYGEYLAIDTGRYNTDEDQHNVVLVDGKPHMPVGDGRWGANRSSGRLADFQRHALLDYARADAAMMKGCAWADRHFLFVRTGGDDAYVVVVDAINVDQTPHALHWQLHTDPRQRIEILGPRSAAVAGTRARLDLTFAVHPANDPTREAETLKLITGEKEWGWPYGVGNIAGNHDRTGLLQTSFKRPRLLAVVSETAGHLLTVLSPRRAGQPALTVRQIPQRKVLHVEIDLGDRIDTVIAALDHGYIKLPGIRGWSELALIRRDRTGRLTDAWTADGVGLEL